MDVRRKSQRGFTVLELLAFIAGFFIVSSSIFATCGGLDCATRMAMNETWQKRAIAEANAWAAASGQEMRGTPVCSTQEIEGRFPCTITMADGRSETLLCPGDYWGIEHGCVMATPFVTGSRGQTRGVVMTGVGQ